MQMLTSPALLDVSRADSVRERRPKTLTQEPLDLSGCVTKLSHWRNGRLASSLQRLRILLDKVLASAALNSPRTARRSIL